MAHVPSFNSGMPRVGFHVGGRPGAQVTADHGNADDMVQRAKKTNAPLKNEKGELQLLTSHTLVRCRSRRPFGGRCRWRCVI